MLPSLRSHKEYIEFVQQNLDSKRIPKVHEDVFDKLKLLDLTPIRLLFLNLYSSDSGRPALAPEDMMRTFVAMTLCGISSPTDWVDKYLKDESGFYAIISGFMPDDIPSVGCMYDFTNRLLNIPKYCKQDHIRHKRKRLTRTQKKKLKDDKLKVTIRHIKIVAKIAKRLQEQHQEQHQEQENQNQEQESLNSVYIPDAEKIVNEILKLCCLNESQARKLLDLKHLNISADGTKLKVHSNPYGKKVCNCQSYHCECKRFYNAKDASLGYDSYRDCYVFGYNLYQINSWSFDNKAELPSYLMIVTAARHDSVSGMYACHRLIKGMGYHVDNACLDTAHDATDFYIMARDVWDMKPFIPLNNTNEGNIKNLPMLSITEDGVPICQAGHQMYYCGYCKDRDRLKWRCPIQAKKNSNLKCDCLDSCSSSSYGRVVYTHPADNPRLYTPVARGTQKWQDTYDHRSSAERVFKREKNDFKLTNFKTRSKERLLFYSLLTAIAVHVDTWYRADNSKSD